MPMLLIVDDDPDIREIFSILLTREGYTVNAASGGTECLDFLTRMTPDLVLLDIMMHPVDGWETLTAIRKNSEIVHIPVIMFSGKSPSREEVVRFGGLIEDYFMKPISMQTITASLNAVFERSQAERAARQIYLQNGAVPELLEEYFHLRKLLFIYSKFSRDFHEISENTGMDISVQKLRLGELERILSASDTAESADSRREVT